MKFILLFILIAAQTMGQSFSLGFVPSQSDATNGVNGYAAYWCPTNNTATNHWFGSCNTGTTNIPIQQVPNGSWLTICSTWGNGAEASSMATPILFDTNQFMMPIIQFPAPTGLGVNQK